MTEPKEMAFTLRKGDWSYFKIKEYLYDIFGIDVSPMTVRNWVEAILAKELR